MTGTEPRPDRLIYFEDLEPRKGIKLSEMTIWRMMKAGTFPPNRLIGQRKAWLESDLDAWLAALPTGKGRKPPGPRRAVDEHIASLTRGNQSPRPRPRQ